MPLQSGQYIIVNATCRNIAVLLDGNEASPLRSRVSGLHDSREGEQWKVDVLGNGTYKIMNIDFGSFAGSDANPEEKEEVLGKSAPYEWVVKQPSWISSIYLISPYYNKDLYWGLPVGHGNGTPLILSSIATDPRNHWLFKPVTPLRCSPQRNLSLDLDSLPFAPLEAMSGQVIPSSQPLSNFIRLMSTLETIFTHVTRLWQARHVITQESDTGSSSITTDSGVAQVLATMVAIFAVDHNMDVGVRAYSALVVAAFFGILCQQLPHTIRIEKSVYIIDILDQRITLSSDIWQSWEKVDEYLKDRQRNRVGSRYVEQGDYYIADKDSQLIVPEQWRAMIKPGMELDMGIILRTLSLATTHQCPRCGILADGVSPKDRDMECTSCLCKFRVREENMPSVSLPASTLKSEIHQPRPVSNESRPTSPEAWEADNSSDTSHDTDLYPETLEERMPEEKEKLLFARIHIIHSTPAQAIKGDEPPLTMDELPLTMDELQSTKDEPPLTVAEPPATKAEQPLTKDDIVVPVIPGIPATSPITQFMNRPNRNRVDGHNRFGTSHEVTPPLSTNDIVILVMGPSGTGKSTFIQVATGKDTGISHDISAGTDTVAVYPFQQHQRRICLVDTPGFDNKRSEADVLETVATWLAATYSKRIILAGILFFQRITDNRMSGTTLKNLKMFRKLCGDECLQNVVLVTTMWSLVDPSKGEQREGDLSTNFWMPLIDRGSRVARFQDNQESAHAIINLLNSKRPLPLLVQRQMVDKGLTIADTSAGIPLDSELERSSKELKQAILELRRERKRIIRGGDNGFRRSVEEEIERLKEGYERTVECRRVLKRNSWKWTADNILKASIPQSK